VSNRPRGPLVGWEPSTERQSAILDDLIKAYARYAERGIKRSPRGAFYDLRPFGFGNVVTYKKRPKDPVTRQKPKLGPMEADPATVQEVLVLARRAGIIDEDLVADDRAPDAFVPLTWDDADEAVDFIAEDIVDYVRGFRLDQQDGQDAYIEVWCEAAGLLDILVDVCRPFHVPVFPAGGFKGLKGKRDAASRVAERDVPTVVLHIGDYDLHGRWIFQSEAEDVACWVPSFTDGTASASVTTWKVSTVRHERVLLRGDGEPEPVLIVERFAVTKEHVDAGLIEIDEEGKAEAEGMPIEWDILRDELEERLDPACREAVNEREEQERKLVPKLLAQRLRKITRTTGADE
jgi:hypothetical protein